MKNILFFVFLVSINTPFFAQKEHEGLYYIRGGNAYLFDDNFFIMVGYGTVVAGNWEVKGDEIVLAPLKIKYLLFGKHSEAINKKTAQIRFKDFENNQSFFGTSLDQLVLIFDPESACVENKTHDTYFNSINKTVVLGKEESYVFKFNDKMNDFLAFYYSKRDYDKLYTIELARIKEYLSDADHKIPKLNDLEKEEQDFFLEMKNLFQPKNYAKIFGIDDDYKLIDYEVIYNQPEVDTENRLIILDCNE